MIILCQGDVTEQIEKLMRLLVYNVQEKAKPGHILYEVFKLRGINHF